MLDKKKRKEKEQTRTPTGSERAKCRSRDCAYMQLRAARSLWMKFLLLRYSIPLAISVMNLTSIWDGRYCRIIQREISFVFVLCLTKLMCTFCAIEGTRAHRVSSLNGALLCSRYSSCGNNRVQLHCVLGNCAWVFQYCVWILFWLGLCYPTSLFRDLLRKSV